MTTTIVTHGGVFHTDEVTAVTILKTIFNDAVVTRTRDPEVIAAADFAVDVGGGMFDHHQRGFDLRDESGGLYASAGLVWRQYGESFLASILPDGSSAEAITAAAKAVNDVVMAVDHHDNGDFSMSSNVSLMAMVTAFNQLPNGFEMALDMVGRFLTATALKSAEAANAAEVVASAVSSAVDGVMVLPRYVPWISAVASLPPGTIKAVVFPNAEGTGFNAQTAKKFIEGGIDNATLFPVTWGGLSGEEFSVAAGIPDGVFCHKALFIAGAKSLESAITLARQAA